MHFGGRFLDKFSRAKRRVPHAPEGIKIWSIYNLIDLIKRLAYQHHLELLVAQYLIVLIHMDRVYLLLAKLNYYVEFSVH
jgi:hypothetical protein